MSSTGVDCLYNNFLKMPYLYDTNIFFKYTQIKSTILSIEQRAFKTKWTICVWYRHEVQINVNRNMIGFTK